MKSIRIIFICFALICFVAPSALMLGGFKNENRENRPLANLPKLITKDGLNTGFAAGLDEFTNDHFALREYLVTAFNAADIALLNDFNGTNTVIGKNGFVYFAETVDDYLGINQLTEEQIDSIAAYLADISADMEKKGVKFAFMTAPNKAAIYPEYMPGYLAVTSNARNIDMLTGKLKEFGVGCVDAKKLLTKAKDERTLYYERDSHWNNFGAMLVYNEIAEQFGLESFDPYTYTTIVDRTGDLNNFVYPSIEYPEERIVYPDFHSYSSKRPINLERDKKIETVSEVNDVTMLVYHDSFCRSLQPFFSQSVGKLYMMSYFPYNLENVDELKPDIFMIELAERNLDKLYEHVKTLGY